MIRRPSSVKIGHLTYAIEWVKAKDLPDAYGVCESQRQVIKLRSGMPPDRLFETAVHEVCHAWWEAHGMPDKATEEQAVSFFGVAVSRFISDNPDWVRWLGSLTYKQC